MKLLFVSSEVAPFSKTGGLADVSKALPGALRARGHDVLTVTPLWPTVSRQGLRAETNMTLHFPFGAVTFGLLRQGSVLFLDAPNFFNREQLYGDSDDARRFAAFTAGALAASQRLQFAPDVVHFNDWQTGLGPMALATGFAQTPLHRAKSLFTIHNLAYQGNFDKHTAMDLGVPWDLFTPAGVEFHEQFSFMKAALNFADALTTVSPTYAHEIQTHRGGLGFDGLLRHRAKDLTGILNGIDIEEWNPANDAHVPTHFSVSDLAGKRACKRALLQKMNINVSEDVPIFATVGRLAEQKGVELLLEALPYVLDRGAAVMVMGSGEARYVDGLRNLERRYVRQMRVHIGFDEALAHSVEAGSDFFVMPSKYEPCGLNQMYSLRYGTVPIVRAVGGLQDTVVDLESAAGTGIKFRAFKGEALVKALERALGLFHNPEKLTEVRKRGMIQDFSWSRSAQQYEALYQRLLT